MTTEHLEQNERSLAAKLLAVYAEADAKGAEIDTQERVTLASYRQLRANETERLNQKVLDIKRAAGVLGVNFEVVAVLANSSADIARLKVRDAVKANRDRITSGEGSTKGARVYQ